MHNNIFSINQIFNISFFTILFSKLTLHLQVYARLFPPCLALFDKNMAGSKHPVLTVNFAGFDT